MMEVNSSNVFSHLFVLLATILSVQCMSNTALSELAELSVPFDGASLPVSSHSRTARDVASSIGRKLIPSYKYCCGGANNTAYTSRRSMEIVSRYLTCGKEAKTKKENQDEWTQHGNPTKDPFSCTQVTKLKGSAHCLANCMMKKRGALNDDDTINTEVAKDVYRNELTSDWIIELAMDAVDKCATNKGNTWIKGEPGMECSTRAANFYHCVWSEIIMKCPDEQYNKNDYCRRVKQAFLEVEN